MSEQSAKTFISYVRVDSEFALKLANDLKSAGADVWVDQLDVPPGKHWDLAVQEALESCPRMLVVLSPISVESKNVMDEVSFALEEGKEVIPVLYRTCKVPFRLRRLQYVDFSGDYVSGVSRMLDTLGVGTKKMSLLTTPENLKVQLSPSSELSLLEFLRKGINARDFSVWNRWRSEHQEIRPDLHSANLNRADLKKANLSEANLSEADLSRADLRQANLSGANLNLANLNLANLRGADLKEADLRGADLNQASLSLATLSGTNLDGAILDGANLSWANLAGARGLTQEQINVASGDKDTQLPAGLQKPNHWVK